jgi:hypothetical protein
MGLKTIKRTLILYLCYAFLFSSVLSIFSLLVEYAPTPRNSLQKFGIGATILNCVLWSFLFTIAGSTSLLNVLDSVRKNFTISLLCFILLPLLELVGVISLLNSPGNIFGFTETGIAFFVTQLFFFFKFKSCIKSVNSP